MILPQLVLVTRQYPTTDRNRNPWRMGGGALKRPKKQKSRISTKIGFKLVRKSVPNGQHNVPTERRNKNVYEKKFDVHKNYKKFSTYVNF